METRNSENTNDKAGAAGKVMTDVDPRDGAVAGDGERSGTDGDGRGTPGTPAAGPGDKKNGSGAAGRKITAMPAPRDVEESISSVIDELEKGKITPESVLEEFRTADVRPSTGTGRRGNDNIGLLMDVQMSVRVELGRTRKSVEEIMSLSPGMVLELDRKAGDNVDLYLNDKLFAEGEVTVVEGNFAIRVTRLVGRL